MKITAIELSNFRGARSHNTELAGVDMIAGNNGTGKTRVLQAVQLGLMGRVPDSASDRNLEPIELMTKDPSVTEMNVELVFSDMSNVTRSFKVKEGGGKVTVSQALELFPQGPTGLKEAEKNVAERYGNFPLMLDIHSFIRMSDAERQKLIYSLSPIDSAWTVEEVLEYLRESVDTMKSEEQLSVVDEYLGIAEKQMRSSKEIRESMNTLELWIKTRTSEVTKAVKQYQGASVVNAEFTETDGKQRLREVADINADLDKATEEYEEQARKIERENGARSTHEAEYRRKVNEINGAIEHLQEMIRDQEFKIASWKKDADTVECPTCKQAVPESRKVMFNAAVDAARVAIDGYKERIRQHEASRPEPTPFAGTINIEEAEMMLQGIGGRMKELREELTKKTMYDANVLAAKRSSLESKKSAIALEVLKKFAGATSSVRFEIIQSALKPLQAQISELISGVIRDDAEFSFRLADARGNDVFQFGWRQNGGLDLGGAQFVDFNSLSTAQQLITLICVVAPLINRANPKLRVLLLDNVEVVDYETRPAFVDLLLKCEGTYLDNIIFATSSSVGFMPSNLERPYVIYVHQAGQPEKVPA